MQFEMARSLSSGYQCHKLYINIGVQFVHKTIKLVQFVHKKNKLVLVGTKEGSNKLITMVVPDKDGGYNIS